MAERKAVPFHGVVAVGNSKDDAINRYKLATVGKGVSAYVDKARSMSFVTNASNLSEMFNPQTGDLDLEESADLLQGLEFESKSNTDGRTVNYFECRSGCGAHVVYDSEAIMKFCPVCTSAVDDTGDEDDSESEDDEAGDMEDESCDTESTSDAADGDGEDDGEDDESEDDESEDDKAAVEASAKSKDAAKKRVAARRTKAQAADEATDTDDESSDEDDESEEDDEAGDSDEAAEASAKTKRVLKRKAKAQASDDDESEGEESDDSDESDEADEDNSAASEPVVVAASTKAEAIQLYQHERMGVIHASAVEVNYKVCASSTCGAHIIHESNDLNKCPVCASDLAEPIAEEADEEAGAISDQDANTVTAGSKKAAITKYQRKLAKAGKAEASADAKVEVNYLVCASDECGAHIVTDAVNMTQCPICASAVAEPEDEDEENDLEVMDTDEDAGEDKESDSETEGSQESSDAKPTEVDALDNLDESSESSHENLDVAYSSSIAGAPVWTAFYKGTPVALAHKADSKHADIFDDSSFGRAVMASAKHAGVANTLKEMGFKAIAYTVNVEQHVSKQVETSIASERDAMASVQKEYKERLLAALATSAIGMSRGFFVGKTNPLKDALYQALSSAGVKNPDVLLYNAFKTSSDQYHNQLFAQACEIMDKPAEVQEGLAKAVLEMNHVANASTESSSVEERLASLGTTHVPAEQTGEVATAAASGDGGFGVKAAAVVSSLGRRIR